MAAILRHMTFRARALRRAATPAECALWERLRGRRLAGFKFRRQHPVGPYVLDFYCERAALAVEADGGQYYPPPLQDGQRDALLAAAGVRVLRFRNEQILNNMPGILQVIGAALRERCPVSAGP
jgi:very-short-patch-repair endonuclease